MIRLPRACRGRTAVRFPFKGSHVCCRFGRKGSCLYRFSQGSRRGIIPVWVYIPVIVVSFAATFEACVFPCGHRLLFVRGFLCCLLLGSLASWVKIGYWFWAPIRFLSCVDTGTRHFWFHLRQGLTFVSFFLFSYLLFLVC